MNRKKKGDLPVETFRTAEEFKTWLEVNQNRTDGIWLKIFKKDADENGISRKDALDEALCFGWIDGQAKKHDEISYLQKFTPRRPGSLWSKRNTEHIERLSKLGKMQSAGLREVEKAKADGRWERAYDPPSEMTIPDDFMDKLSKHPKALTFFKTLNKTNLYSIVWRLQTAKKTETRNRRMKAIFEMLTKGEKFH